MADIPPLKQQKVPDCDLVIDVVITSCDGQSFGAHSRNLEMYSKAFPPSAFVSPDTTRDPVHLTETAKIVEFILCYTHNERLPDLEEHSVAFAIRFAEAVEKYVIHHAMEVCKLHMKYRILKTHPTAVLTYACKYDYDDLFDEAAPYTLTWEMDDAYAALGCTKSFTAWIRYRERWQKIHSMLRSAAPVPHNDGRSYCPKWDRFSSLLFQTSISVLGDWDRQISLNTIKLSVSGCPWCIERAEQLGEQVKAEVRRMPRASSFK